MTGVQVTSFQSRQDRAHTVGGLPSQMKLGQWQAELRTEPDDNTKEFILQGIEFGFAIVDSDVEIPNYYCANYNSALKDDVKQFFDDLFNEEIASYKYKLVEAPPWCVHAIGAVPKGDTDYRPITDCRRPIGLSINNFMNSTFNNFRYETLDNVCTKLKVGTYMATVDIASAYRSISVMENHWKYQGVSWDFGDGMGLRYMVDTRLCFGLCCAPYIFTVLSDAIVSMMKRKGFDNVFAYLDDFLILGDNFDECQQAQMVLIDLLIRLGFYINWKKCTTPAVECEYLGVLINTEKMELSLPQDKVEKLHTELAFFRYVKRAARKEC